jgi:DNA-binding PadR family transcriptional regulator
MSTQHALLISLIERPSSGYELARRFDRSIGYFWHATHQQIYRELGRMAEAGWISAEEGGADLAEAGEKKSRKKVYSVLPAGRDELVRWTLLPGAGLDQREDILIRLRADALIGPLGLGKEMQRLIDEHQARLEIYQAIVRKEYGPGSKPGRAQQLRLAMLQRGIRYEQDWVAWGQDLMPLLATPAEVVQPTANAA